MKYLLKQLKLFFPFIFPMYDVVPRDADSDGHVQVPIKEYSELLRLKREARKPEEELLERTFTIRTIRVINK